MVELFQSKHIRLLFLFKALLLTVNDVSLGCSENHQCGGHIFTRSCVVFRDFFTCHSLCILTMGHQGLTYKCPADTHKNHRTTRELPLLHCLHITHAHAACTHTTVARTRWLSLVRPILVDAIDPGNHFFYHCTLIMTYSFRTGDQCATQRLSQKEEKVDGTLERVNAYILWSILDIFDCAIVLHRELNAYLEREEESRWLLLCLSLDMFCGGETHYWQWHKQLFSSQTERKETSKQR